MKGKISISETGVVTMATSVQMQDFEIAELFGVLTPTVKSNIRAIAFRVQSHKAGIFRKWIIHKMTTMERQPIVLQYNCNAIHLSDRN